MREGQRPLFARTFLVDPDRHTCYVHGAIVDRGMCKNVRRVFEVPFECSSPVVHRVGKINRIVKDTFDFAMVNASEGLFRHFLKEIEATAGSPVFPHQYLALQYVKTMDGGITFNKVEVIEEAMQSSFGLRLSALPKRAQIQFLHQVLAFLTTLWPRIHGDLKPSNVLYRLGQGEEMSVKLTDWGFCCTPRDGELAPIMEEGMYGSLVCTAPEVIGQDPKTVDWYKAESWALGCCLYRWVYGRGAPWEGFVSILYEGIRFGTGPQPSDVERLCENIRVVIEARASSLESISSPSTREIAKICFALLELNPRLRKTIPEMLEYLNSLMKTEGHPLCL